MRAVALRESKPIAALSSSLLARKGQARPAMRPQGLAGPAGAARDLNDLGWNDMGEDAAPVPRIAPRLDAAAIAASPADEAEVAEAEVAQAALPAGRRKAFTLRLDPDRHMRLRLASAVRRCSSQWLVTQALDAYLAGEPVSDQDPKERP